MMVHMVSYFLPSLWNEKNKQWVGKVVIILVMISDSLVHSSSHHTIIEDGDNPSDHLPIVMQLQVNVLPAPPKAPRADRQPYLKWEKCSEEDTRIYTTTLNDLLFLNPSQLHCCQNPHCENGTCRNSIQQEYDTLICLMKNADSVLPRYKPGIAKSWWTPELQNLKQQSIDIDHLWKTEGRPCNGSTHQERLCIRASYRRAIKNARVSSNQKCWDNLHQQLANKDTDNFWKTWKKLYNKSGSHLHPVVNGVSSKEGIADTFKTHFMKHSQPNDAERVRHLNEEFILEYQDYKRNHISNCDCLSYNVTLQTVVDAVFSMKKGKSCDDDGLFAEHFFNAPFSMFQRIQVLMNSMLLHSFVPRQFRFGTIVPIVKDHQGNMGDTDNYRGITMSPIMSKILEHTMRILFSESLTTSKFQFGFKSNS